MYSLFSMGRTDMATKKSAKKSAPAKATKATAKKATKSAAKKSTKKTGAGTTTKAIAKKSTKAAAKKATRKAAAKRELIAPNNDKRFVRREKGKFSESDDVGRSLSQDVKKAAKKKVAAGQGDRGDQKRKKK